MSEHDTPAGRSGEEEIDEEGRNPTQQRIDEEGASSRPVDAEEGESGGGPDERS